MDRDPTPVAEFGTATPSVARTYDYLLGGKDNYEVDRQAVEMLRTVAPEAPVTARMNREFGKRAVRYIAEQGIRQFIDLGSGIPTSPPSVHDAVRGVNPTVRVVYVDVDPVVAAHSRALRSIGPGLDTILADIRRPETVLDHPDLQALIDFNEPVGVVIFSVLDVIEDKDNPLGIFRQFRERMTPGSYLGISHLSARSAPDAIARPQRSLLRWAEFRPFCVLPTWCAHCPSSGCTGSCWEWCSTPQFSCCSRPGRGQ